MDWLQPHAWWSFALLAALIVVVRLTELASGGPNIWADSVLALTGMSNAELASKSSEAYELTSSTSGSRVST
jgi:hypothetical protein